MNEEKLTKYLELYKTAQDELIEAIKAYTEIAIEHDKLEFEIEKKKSELLSSGMIDGKNAEARAAALWMAVPEYDDLSRLSAEKKWAQTDLEVARLNYAFSKDTFYARGTLFAEQGALEIE